MLNPDRLTKLGPLVNPPVPKCASLILSLSSHPPLISTFDHVFQHKLATLPATFSNRVHRLIIYSDQHTWFRATL